MNKQVTWKALNAYVDGELSPDDAAEVARAAAKDGALAQRIAYLTSLKAAVSGQHECKNPDIDLKESGKRTRWLARAASVAVISLVGTLIASMLLLQKEITSQDHLAYAEAAHNNWQAIPASTRETRQSGAMKVSVDTLNINVHVPDLTRAELTYDGMRTVPMGSGKGVHIGYRGPSGCMVSLVAFKNPKGLTHELATYDQGNQAIYGWQAKDTGYYLMASRMDPDRLQKIARVIHQLIKTHSVLNNRSILALKQAKADSSPCLS